MANKWTHWCPKALNIDHFGKSKSVVYRGTWKDIKPYVCNICGYKFNKKELEDI